MMSASFGSATLKRNMIPPFRSVTADDERAGRLPLQHEDLGPLGDRLFSLRRVGVEALPPSANRDHHFAHLARLDRTGAVSDLADELVIGLHRCPIPLYSSGDRPG